MLNTKIYTIEELSMMFMEELMNHTDKVTKVSPNSAVSGISYGIAKIGQKTLKEVALVESHIFPDAAYGSYLDKVAKNYGISNRFGSSGSSGYVRVVGTPGTVYTAGTNVIKGNHGVVFDIQNSVTIDNNGFAYISVRSQTTGEKTNVDPLSLNQITPIPSGHKYCVNEYNMVGGRDLESDELFRQRIKEGSNILARGTIAMLEQVFMSINSNVLKVYYEGIDSNGKTVLAILTQNGIDLTNSELNDLLLKGKEYFSITELKPDNINGYGIVLKNRLFQPVDVSARLELYPSFNGDEVRKEIQIRLNKYFDFRFWNKKKVEWDDLLQIVKSTPGVKYVLDNFFSPNVDQKVEFNKLPRMRGFLMLNPNGTLISDSGSILNPVYYPQQLDFNYQKTVFTSL